MSEQPQETPQEPITPPQPTPEPNEAQPDQGDGETKTDEEQGVGTAPTQPGDAGEGNPGTHFESTDEIEEKLGRTGEEGKAD